MSEWDHFIHKGKLVEELFAQKHLSDIKWSNNYQNIHEHWDMQGGLNGKTFKFDVKGMKKKASYFHKKYGKDAKSVMYATANKMAQEDMQRFRREIIKNDLNEVAPLTIGAAIKAKKAGIPLSEACEFEWHSGEGSVKFDSLTMKRIKNMTKMATMFIKYDVSERWMRAFIDMDLNESSSKQLSECQYLESLKFRLGDKIENEFDEILKGMHFKY